MCALYCLTDEKIDTHRVDAVVSNEPEAEGGNACAAAGMAGSWRSSWSSALSAANRRRGMALRKIPSLCSTTTKDFLGFTLALPFLIAAAVVVVAVVAVVVVVVVVVIAAASLLLPQ